MKLILFILLCWGSLGMAAGSLHDLPSSPATKQQGQVCCGRYKLAPNNKVISNLIFGWEHSNDCAGVGTLVQAFEKLCEVSAAKVCCLASSGSRTPMAAKACFDQGGQEADARECGMPEKPTTPAPKPPGKTHWAPKELPFAK